MRITSEQDWILNYLYQQHPLCKTPTQIGLAYWVAHPLRETGASPSAWVCSRIKRLVKLGCVERIRGGKYGFVKSPEQSEAMPCKAALRVDYSTHPSHPLLGVKSLASATDSGPRKSIGVMLDGGYVEFLTAGVNASEEVVGALEQLRLRLEGEAQS